MLKTAAAQRKVFHLQFSYTLLFIIGHQSNAVRRSIAEFFFISFKKGRASERGRKRAKVKERDRARGAHYNIFLFTLSLFAFLVNFFSYSRRQKDAIFIARALDTVSRKFNFQMPKILFVRVTSLIYAGISSSSDAIKKYLI